MDRCKHCDQKLVHGSQNTFCCHGCENAYHIIHDLGLENFYNLKRESDVSPVNVAAAERLGYLDSDEFRRTTVRKNDDGTESALLELQGLSCYACVWLVERAVQKTGASQNARVNLTMGRAEITYDPKATALSSVAALIEHLGYRVSASADTPALDRNDILRLGIAWFCFLNVMAIAFADYLDPQNQIEPMVALVFRGVSLALTLPTVFYSARTFYEKAWVALKNKQISIDQSISVSIITVFSYSVFTTVTNAGPVYFDSVCGGIALLLSARLFQQGLLRKSQREIRALLEPAEKFVRVYRDDNETSIPLTDLKVGDLFRVFPGEWIPVAAEVAEGSGAVNLEPLTGEPKWQPVKVGTSISSGAFNGATSLTLCSLEEGKKSYWQDMSHAVDHLLETKGRMKEFSDKAAFIFLVFVNGLAASLFFYFAWQGDFAEGARRAFALALIACPCAFGLTAPLVFSACAAKGLAKGVLFKSQRAIEDLSRAKRFIFDKTGTLTEGDLKVVAMTWNETVLSENALSRDLVLQRLEILVSNNQHAASHAIKNWLTENKFARKAIERHNVTETFGGGVTFDAPEGVYRLGHAGFALGRGRQSNDSTTRVFFSFQERLLAQFELDDKLMDEAKDVVQILKARDRQVEILSGDGLARTKTIAAELGIQEVRAEAKPEDKAARVRGVLGGDLVVMVGNGSNDSLAMAQASVSIAVAHSTSASRHAADICLTSPGLRPCADAFFLATAARKVFRRGMSFAFAYNTLGSALAIGGWVTPGVAAALMPISSLIIVMISTRWREPSMGRVA